MNLPKKRLYSIAYKSFVGVLVVAFILQFMSFINLYLPNGKELLFNEYVQISEQTFEIKVTQHYRNLTEPYSVEVTVVENSSNATYREQIAFEQLKWTDSCSLKFDESSGTCSILNGDNLYFVINPRERWFIDHSGNYFNYKMSMHKDTP